MDVSEHDGDSTDHGIMIGCMKLASNGYLTPTEEVTSTNTAPDTYEITTDEQSGKDLLTATNTWLAKNSSYTDNCTALLGPKSERCTKDEVLALVRWYC
jgi:hypothetical protein